MERLDLAGVGRFTIIPVGPVPYDGQSLPVIAPDGRTLATQEGPPAPWPTLLAQRQSSPPTISSTIRLYALQPGQIRPIAPSAVMPPGLLLGRSGSPEGCLVEQPRPGGARAIGLLPWNAGPVRWLVEDEACNAHAVLAEDGSLAFVRRAPGETNRQLVLRTPAGALRTLERPEVDLFAPLFAPDRGLLGALAIVPGRGLLLLGFQLSPEVQGSLEVCSATELSDSEDPAIAWQALAASVPLPSPVDDADVAACVIVTHPATARALRVNLRTGERSFVAPPGHAAVAMNTDPVSFAVADDRQVLFVPGEPRDPRPVDAPPVDAASADAAASPEVPGTTPPSRPRADRNGAEPASFRILARPGLVRPGSGRTGQTVVLTPVSVLTPNSAPALSVSILEIELKTALNANK
jgi:hypothetical protein